MGDPILSTLTPLQQLLVEETRKRQLQHFQDFSVILPWRRPCVVKVLLVTDGGLDFGRGDFGLSTFVSILLHDKRSYVAFDLTLAHLRADVQDQQVMAGAAGITRSIKDFAFDDPAHFTPDAFDEVWLFGIETNFHQAGYARRRAQTARYPADRLGRGELVALAEHMNRGGGLFATGDHGSLGRALGGSVDRVRGMRHWQSFSGPAGPDEVSMDGPRRNDSNEAGHDAGFHFHDQSDDVPQRLDLKLYTTPYGLLRVARYPHPVLCSHLGRIDVFPDHPHEGECRVPPDLLQSSADGSPEYPAATDGSGQVVPEVVAWGRVRSGNNALVGGFASKISTQAHSFGVVSVYDGHRAGVGRVVCDSTWHHVVNVNLIGRLSGAPNGEHASKDHGFLASASGLAALDKIREYYVNVGVWISPPARIACMRFRPWWDIVWDDRVVEATTDDPGEPLERLRIFDLYHIGVHARDVLGRAASPCQSLQWILFPIERLWPELVPFVNPWFVGEALPEEPPLPWFDPEPLLAVATGGAVVALREAFPYPDARAVEQDDQEVEGILMRGAEVALGRAREQMRRQLEEVSQLMG